MHLESCVGTLHSGSWIQQGKAKSSVPQEIASFEEITRKKLPHVLVSFPVIVMEMPNESNLNNKGLILAHSSRALFLMVGISKLQVLKAPDSITPTISSRALWMLAHTQLTFTVLYSPQSFALKLVLTTVEIGPPTSNRIKILFHRHIQGPSCL
jgi:hypothetical protein